MTTAPGGPAAVHPARDGAAVAVGALAIAVAVASVFFRPALLAPAAVVLSLIGVLLSDRWRRFAAASAAVAALAWFVGMIVAVAVEHPLY